MPSKEKGSPEKGKGGDKPAAAKTYDEEVEENLADLMKQMVALQAKVKANKSNITSNEERVGATELLLDDMIETGVDIFDDTLVQQPFSPSSIYCLLMKHGSRPTRVIFAICQLLQILFTFGVTVPAFWYWLASNDLSSMQSDDWYETKAQGGASIDSTDDHIQKWDDWEEESSDAWKYAKAHFIWHVKIFALFSVTSAYLGNIKQAITGLTEANRKLGVAPHMCMLLVSVAFAGFVGGCLYFITWKDYDFKYVTVYALLVLPCWLPVIFTAMCKGSCAEIWFVRFACMAGLINDLSIVVFSWFLTWYFPAIGFSIAIGLAVVSDLDEWIFNWFSSLHHWVERSCACCPKADGTSCFAPSTCCKGSAGGNAKGAAKGTTRGQEGNESELPSTSLSLTVNTDSTDSPKGKVTPTLDGAVGVLSGGVSKKKSSKRKPKAVES